MSIPHRIALLAAAFAMMWVPLAQAAPAELAAPAAAAAPVDASNPIPPGTKITMQNWQQYKQYMTDGMQAFFAGTYHWKFPSDFELEIGPTRHYPLGSREYIENTEKYASQVRIENLPDGGHNILNYTAGLPFPSPSEPLKGWKILVNDWFAYQPYELCGPNIAQWFKDRFGNANHSTILFAERRMAHISDPGQPIYEPKTPNADFIQYAEELTPEQARYTSILSIWPRDLRKNIDTYVFVPALRRTLRLSTTARCSPAFGSDFTYDDTRHGAFNGSITQFDAKFLRDRKILEAPQYNIADSANPEDSTYFFKSVWFSTPALSKWQVRDAYQIDVRRIPELAAGYCYGSRILYVDKESMQAMWADLYDSNMKLWKIDYDPQAITEVPNVGNDIWTNNGWGSIYDVQNEHMTFVALPLYAGDTCKNLNGVNYTDINRYFSVNGLSQLMQ
ncbi:MAG: DUF1329 domain-containing protein [Candidatus Binataceae bacterium]